MDLPKIPNVKINTEEIDALLIDVLNQACGITVEGVQMIDNSCLSAYESACDYLVEHGYLTTQNTRIYHYTKKADALFGIRK